MTKARPKAKRKATARPIHRKWPPEWQALIDQYGGTAEALGKAIGVSGMTIGRWADGIAEPNEPTKRQINQIAAMHRLKAPFK